MSQRLVTIFSGTVQCVGFRYTTLHIARRFTDISGYVRNLPDGRVELVAEGSPQDLEHFVAEVRDAMQDYISHTDSHTEQPIGEFSAFRLRY